MLPWEGQVGPQPPEGVAEAPPVQSLPDNQQAASLAGVGVVATAREGEDRAAAQCPRPSAPSRPSTLTKMAR